MEKRVINEKSDQSEKSLKDTQQLVTEIFF